MSNKYENVVENAILASKNPDNHFIVDIIAEIGVTNFTFYNYVIADGAEHKEILENLRLNRARTKQKMRKQWATDGHPTLQVSLMKLIGTDEERKRLSQAYIDIESKGEKVTGFDLSKLSTAALLELAKAYDKSKEAPEENEDN